MAHTPQVETAASAVRKLWERHGIQNPLRFLGFCLSLLPIPVIQEAGQALEAHLAEKEFQTEVARIWGAIQALNPAVDRIDKLEDAIAEVARTVEENGALRADVERFIHRVADVDAEFRILTSNQSFQSIVNTLVVAERAVVEATGNSTNVLNGVQVRSGSTLLKATEGSANYVTGSTFGDATGSVTLQGVHTVGAVSMQGSSVGMNEGTSINLGEGSAILFGVPSSLLCPRCGTMFMGQMWIDDLKKVVSDLGFDYRLENGHTLQDYCPRCKRIMRGLAYAGLPQVKEKVFVGRRAEDK